MRSLERPHIAGRSLQVAIKVILPIGIVSENHIKVSLAIVAASMTEYLSEASPTSLGVARHPTRQPAAIMRPILRYWKSPRHGIALVRERGYQFLPCIAYPQPAKEVHPGEWK